MGGGGGGRVLGEKEDDGGEGLRVSERNGDRAERGEGALGLLSATV